MVPGSHMRHVWPCCYVPHSHLWKLLGFHPAISSPSTCPSQQLSCEGFLPKQMDMKIFGLGADWLLVASSCSPPTADVGLEPTSGHVPDALKIKLCFMSTPTQPCPIMPWTQPSLFKTDFGFYHTIYRPDPATKETIWT